MKDSKEYSKKLQKLYLRLRREQPRCKKVVYEEPVEALVYAIVSEDMSKAEARTAIKRFAEKFVDLNDLRVSLTEEIVEALGSNAPAARNVASLLTRALNYVFNHYNMVTLASLKKIGKRPARQALEKIEGISTFVIDYCMLTALQGHAVPLTKKMIEYLRRSGIVHPDADEQEIEGFLTRQISAENAYEFYYLLRRESESSGAGAGRNALSKAKTEMKEKKSVKRKITKKE